LSLPGRRELIVQAAQRLADISPVFAEQLVVLQTCRQRSSLQKIGHNARQQARTGLATD